MGTGEHVASAGGPDAPGLRLVRVETTSNQLYLATSSRVRHLVAASELLARSTTTWVREAIAGLPVEVRDAVRVITAVSGVALLLVPDGATARAVVRTVTRRAVDEAPGLVVHGAAVPLASEDGAGLADALGASARRLAHLRAGTADGVTGELMLPFVAACPYTARPASTLLPPADRPGGMPGLTGGGPVSAFIGAAEAGLLRDEAFARLARLLTDVEGPRRAADEADEGAADGADGAVAERARVEKGMRAFIEGVDARAGDEASWMAVVHADGNGIGGVFMRLSDELRAVADLDAAVDRFRAVSEAVDRAAAAALRAAVADVARDAGGPVHVLPLVCAGDDLTLLAPASAALPLVVAYARAFERESLERVPGASEGFTIGAGAAVTKPGHPIRMGLELSEELAAAAKRAGRARAGADGRAPSTVDALVLHGSGGVGLAGARRRTGSLGGPDDAPLPRSAGPWVVAAADAPDGGAEDVALLQRLVAAVAGDGPVGSFAQRVRVAVEQGRAAVDDLVRRADLRPGTERAVTSLAALGLDLRATVGRADAESDARRVLLVDAGALAGVLTRAERRAAGDAVVAERVPA